MVMAIGYRGHALSGILSLLKLDTAAMWSLLIVCLRPMPIPCSFGDIASRAGKSIADQMALCGCLECAGEYSRKAQN